MIELMDKNGRIIRIKSEFYVGTEDGAEYPTNSALSADETVLDLLKQAPSASFLRGPYVAPDRGERKGS